MAGWPGHEPGEGVDRVVPRALARPRGGRTDRLEDVAQDLGSLTEDVEDLFEPGEEFELFDQCMFTVEVSSSGRAGGNVGYVFGAGRRSASPRPASTPNTARGDLT